KRWAFNGSSFSATPASIGTYKTWNSYTNSPPMSLSSNGTVAGSAILWAVSPAVSGFSAATLRAYNAADVSVELWDSNQRGSLDAVGTWSIFTPPTIANGKVYVPTLDGVVNVYG